MDDPEAAAPSLAEPYPGRRRYAALLVFCLFTFNNGFSWLVFDPVVDDVAALFAPRVGAAQVELLSSWQPLVYIAAFYAMSALLTRPDGLRRGVTVGAAAEVTGAMLKVAASGLGGSAYGLLLLNAGQVCSAVGAPVAIGAPSLLSALWFPPEQRTRATACAVLCNNVGNAAVYLLVPPLAAAAGFQAVLLAELLIAIACLACVLAVMPSTGVRRHAAPPMDDGRPEPRGVCGDLAVLVATPSAVLLFAVYSWSSGGYVAWTSLFDVVLRPRFGDVFIGQLSFASTVAYIVGGLSVAVITDAYFRRRMKLVLLTATVLNGVASLWFLASTDGIGGAHLAHGSAWAVAAGAVATGACSGAAAPIFYELVAEITFPVSEGVSGGCLSLCENVGALVFYQVVVRVVGTANVNVAYTVGITAALVLCAAVTERYRRPAFRDLSDSDFDNDPAPLTAAAGAGAADCEAADCEAADCKADSAPLSVGR